MPTTTVQTPLQYHMNDLIYYLGLATGGTIEKRISLLEAIGAMATGMVASKDTRTIEEVQEFTDAVTVLRNRHYFALDNNQYLVPQIRRMKIAVNVVTARAFFLVDEHKLITGNIMRTRLVNAFGKDRYIGGEPSEDI
jgi:hypothetical protein